MENNLPKPLYILPREERNAAAREVARYCLLPDPRPVEKQSRWERFKSWINPSIDDRPLEQCVAEEVGGKIRPPYKPQDMSRQEFREIMQQACIREDIGRLKGQVRDFHDSRNIPQSPLAHPHAVPSALCKQYTGR